MKKYYQIPLVLLIGLLFLTTINQGVGSNHFIKKGLQATEDAPIDPWMNIDNGTRVNITAGNRTHLRTQSGNHIRIQTNESVQLRLNESECNPVGTLPNQTRSVNRFMDINLNGTVAMNTTMFRNYTNSELSELGNVSTFRWAYYNEESFQWEYAHQNWVESTSNGFSVLCSTDHFSVWTIIAPNLEIVQNPTPGTPFNSNNGTAFMVQLGNQYQIKTQAGFTIQLQLNKSAEITISEYEKTSKVMKRERHQIRTQTMSIELNQSAGLNATFSYQFTNQIRNQLNISNLAKLKFMFFNETSNSWEAPKNQWIEGDMLYCNTTHFSLWTVAEEEVGTSSPGFTIIPLLIIFGAITIIYKRK